MSFLLPAKWRVVSLYDNHLQRIVELDDCKIIIRKTIVEWITNGLPLAADQKQRQIQKLQQLGTDLQNAF